MRPNPARYLGVQGQKNKKTPILAGVSLCNPYNLVALSYYFKFAAP